MVDSQPSDARLTHSDRVSRARATHPYAFRSGEWAKVLTIVESHGRDCWLVQFEDGVTDWWPIEDDSYGYEIEVLA